MRTTEQASHDHRQTNIDGYDRWAGFYDQYPNPTVAMDELAFPDFWKGFPGQHVLEIGCGTGRHTARLLAAGKQVTGVDQSPGMLAMARAKLGPAPTLLQGDFLTLELAEAGFDAALTALVLEHIADLPGFFRHLARSLRPGAPFFISEIHPARTAAGTFAHFKDAETGTDVSLASYPHSAEQLAAAATGAGFQVRERHDVAGDDRLAALNPKWARYQGQPMLQLWQLIRR